MDIMLDIETFGNRSNSVIVSIGAIQFDMNTGKLENDIYLPIDVDSCLEAGLRVDASTITWWLNQNEQAQKKITNPNRLKLEYALRMLSTFIQPDDIIWGNSARFDCGLLNDAYSAMKMETPWKFYNERDVRTLVALAPQFKKEHVFIGVKHDPLSDCINQINYCTKTWNHLQLNKHE